MRVHDEATAVPCPVGHGRRCARLVRRAQPTLKTSRPFLPRAHIYHIYGSWARRSPNDGAALIIARHARDRCAYASPTCRARIPSLVAIVRYNFAAAKDFLRRRGQNPVNHHLHGPDHERGQRPGRRKQSPDDGKQAPGRPTCIVR